MVYVSRDVIFDKHVFPFHRDSQNSGSTHSNFRDMHIDNSSVILSNDHLCAPLPANPLQSRANILGIPVVLYWATARRILLHRRAHDW
jgi:hypothetical protein